MSRLYRIDDVIERSKVHELSRERGFELISDPPWTNGVRSTSWVRGEEYVTYITYAASGLAMLALEVENDDDRSTIVEILGAKPSDEVFDEIDITATPEKQIETFYRLGLLLVAAGVELSRRVFEAQARYLESPDTLVRWAAARALENCAMPQIASALEKAAKSDPELTPVFEYVKEACDAAEDGTLHDGPTDSWSELIRRAREGLEKEQWKRVVKATDDLFQHKLDHPEGLYLRSLSYEATGRPLLAYALLGAASEAVRVETRYRDKEERDEDPLDDLAHLRDEIEAARARIAELIGKEATDDDVKELDSWLDRWSQDELYGGATLSYGAAKPLIDRMPQREGVFAYIVGGYDLELPLLERARELVPDSPSCLRKLGDAHFKKDERDDAKRFYINALGRLRSDEPLSAQAKMIETLDARERLDHHSDESILLEQLATIEYEAENWNEAASLADELVEVDCQSLQGWQLRANARTFALRHEEAVTAYEEALSELDRAYGDEECLMFGDDPRSLMQNNLSAVLAKLGRREESLDMLRKAVQGDEKWGALAKKDDYFEALWDDPEFLAVTSADPRALVTSEEKTPESLDALIMRSIGLFYRGNVNAALEAAERAAKIAEWEGMAELEARALSAWGYALAFSGAPGQALELLTKAAALVEADDVSGDVRAETIHTYGVALRQAEQFDEAQKNYERALELRRAHHGEDHPVVAKSFGDMSRLAEARGAPAEEVLAYIEKGIAILETALEQMTEDEARRDDRIEILVDVGTQKINVGHVLAGTGRLAEALDAVEYGIGHLDNVVELEGVLNPSLLDNAQGLVDRIARNATDDAILQQADALFRRLDELLIPGPPHVRRERRYWRGLRRFADSLRSHGVQGEEIAQMFSDALKGGDNLSPDLLALQELGSFAKALAERTVHEPTLLITAAMALETARATGDIEEALMQLEGLCIAALPSSA